MFELQKGKGKQRSPGKDIDLTKSTLLDAYTDSPTSSGPSKDDNKPVTKKNKNQRKREAEKLRKKSESENKPEEEEEEVIESWEDIESNAEEGTQLPRTIEFPTIANVKEVEEKLETLSITETPKVEVKAEHLSNVENPIQLKLEKLDGTLKSIDGIFASKPEVKKSDIEKMEVKETKEEKVQQNVKPKSDSTSKSAEEIKAEREEKKKAKAAAKEKAKNKDNSATEAKKTENADKKSAEEPSKNEKTPEEIKAEREAKKKAKAASKEKAKNKDNTTVESSEKPTKNDVKQPVDEQNETDGKSKAQLKAERRAKQEAQRAAKLASEAQKKEESKSKTQLKRVPDEIQADRASVEKKHTKRLASQQILPRTKAQRKVQLFSHLHQYEREFSISSSYPIVGSHIHPSIMTLGLQFAEGGLHNLLKILAK